MLVQNYNLSVCRNRVYLTVSANIEAFDIGVLAILSVAKYFPFLFFYRSYFFPLTGPYIVLNLLYVYAINQQGFGMIYHPSKI